MTEFTGSLAVVAQTRNDQANQLISLVLRELREMHESPVSDAELESTKIYDRELSVEARRSEGNATMMLQMELYHLGDDFPDRYPELIGAVTRSDIQRVARKYIHPESLILILWQIPPRVSISASRF